MRLAVALPVIAAAVGVAEVLCAVSAGQTQPRWGLALTSLVSCLAAGVLEEVLFRGGAFPLLISVFDPGEDLKAAIRKAAVAQAAIFALMHLTGTLPEALTWVVAVQAVAKVAAAFAFGMLMAALYVLTRNLLVPVGVHVAYDVLSEFPRELLRGTTTTYLTGQAADALIQLGAAVALWAALAIVLVRAASPDGAFRLPGGVFRRGERNAEAPFVRFHTLAGPMLIYTIAYGDAEEPVRVMEVDGAFQSATYVEDGKEYEPVFDYFKAYDCLYGARVRDGLPAPAARLLMLGGGGFAYPKHVVAHHPESAICVVELDPTVIAVARRYFFLDRLEAEFDAEATGRLRIIEGDAVRYLEGFAGEPYDCILNDLFSGREAVAALACADGARLIRRCLAPGGLYLTNVISALTGEGAGVLTRLADEFRQVFAHVYVVPVGAYAEDDRDNNLLVASDAAWIIPGARELT